MRAPFRIGEKVYLRALERADAVHLQPWLNDIEITRGLILYRPISLDAEETIVSGINKSERELILGIVDLAADALVGGIGLHDIDPQSRQARLGLFIGNKTAQGMGFGTEATRLMVTYAFDTLNLNRVSLKVYENNPRAAHVYEKVGFVREGVLRQDAYREGRYLDATVMSVLRDEWKVG
jgi:[ribosomal protein S5]-alanine N-acetyltransferase